MTTTTMLQLGVTDELGQIPRDYRVEVPADLTTQELVDHLKDEGHLPARTPNGTALNYDVSAGGTMLIPDVALGEQGVTDGDTLQVHNKNIQGC